MAVEYKAKQGDIIWLDFDPHVGNEQGGKRPALVISNNTFNTIRKSNAIVCPITNTDRGLPIQPKLDERTKTTGFIMCDQVKTLNLKARNAEFKEKAPDDIVFEAIDIIIGFIEKPESGI